MRTLCTTPFVRIVDILRRFARKVRPASIFWYADDRIGQHGRPEDRRVSMPVIDIETRSREIYAPVFFESNTAKPRVARKKASFECCIVFECHFIEICKIMKYRP